MNNLINITMRFRLSALIVAYVISISICAQTDSLTDIDGNTYKIIKIQNQISMAENLKTTRLNDGTPIPLIDNSLIWQKTLQPGLCWYNNDEKTNKTPFGALYNWFAVETGKLCPVGWHVPTDKVWLDLQVIPAGYRDENGSYWYLKDRSIYWTSTEYTSEKAYYQSVHLSGNSIDRYFTSKKYGHSVRCIKNN